MSTPFLFHPALRCSLAAAAVIALSGCAAQQSFKQGEELLRQGRTLESIAYFEEANRLEPGSAAYRIALLRAREGYLDGLLQAADTARSRQQDDEAERLYRQVLAIQGNSDRATTGLRALDQQRRAAAVQAMAPPPAPVPTPETTLAAAYRKPIGIEFKDASLKTVFEVIARTSGLNFLFDKDVKTDQKTSIFLKNSTIEAAVNLTLLTNQLEQRVLDANTVLIYPNTPAKLKDYQPLTVKSFYLSNADAKSVAATLKAILKTRDVVVDEKLNMLILRDSPEAVRLAAKLVALHDQPEAEVMLEVEILEVKRTRLLDLGIRWPDQLSLAPLPGAAGGTLRLSDLRNLNSASLGATISPLTINARKQDTDANILANPRIRVRNREKAKILIGERVPNISSTATATGFVSESVNYVDVGLKLDVEPTIYLDSEVSIKVALEVSNIITQIQTKAGSVAYQIGTRTAQTVLRLKDGENQVLAGLINDEDRRAGYKVPGLGEVPVAGRLFGSQADDSSKTEIVLSITPRIVRNLRRLDAEALEFESGTESSLGSRLSVGAPAGPIARPGTQPVVRAPVAPALPAAGQAAQPAAAGTSAQAASTSATAPATFIGSNVAAGASDAAQVRWQGPTQLKAGDSFALQLVMQSDQPVASVPLTLGFDPRVLQLTSVSEGEFLKQGGAQTSFSTQVDAPGQLQLTGTRQGGSGATVPGTLATINLRVATTPAAQTEVRLLSLSAVTPAGATVSMPLPAPHLVNLAP